jgi:hypothetical protein
MLKKSLIKKVFFFFIFSLGIIFFINSYSSAQLPYKANDLCEYHEEIYQDLNLDNLRDELETNGLIGSIHGAAADYNLFVLSVRNPNNFFEHQEFSLVTKNKEIANNLASLKRHDQVCLKGSFLNNSSPQKHILVESIIVKQPYDNYNSGLDLEPYQRDINLPNEIKENNSFTGKVHISGENGKILVMEYKDLILPIFVRTPSLTENLYRNDIIKLNYKIQPNPKKPTHLRLNLASENPIEIIDSMAMWHEQEKILTGKLVKFPQSPQVSFDVYALEVETEGIKRYFTLVNFANPEEFKNIREKLTQIWDNNLETVISGRNMLVNPNIIIEAQGIINVESPVQANPQILLDNPDSINQINLT